MIHKLLLYCTAYFHTMIIGIIGVPLLGMKKIVNGVLLLGSLTAFCTSLVVYVHTVTTQHQTTIKNQTAQQVAQNNATIANDLPGLQINGGLNVKEAAVISGGIQTNGGNINAGSGIIKASNIVYSLAAGNGISVGTGQTPTISNTGVLSLQNQTGALSFTAGNGIGISGLTITNSDPGSSQNIFKNIAITGQNTITAGSNNDTLGFVAGTGITLSTDSTNKNITINASSSVLNVSGWTVNSTTNTVSLQTPTDFVGIGTSTPQANLDVSGNASVSGNLTFNTTSAGISVLNGGVFNFQTAPSGQGDAGLASVFYISNTGNVGIGSTSPTSALYISTATSTSVPAIDVRTPTNAGGDTSYIQFDTRAQAGYDGSAGAAYLQGGSTKNLELQTNGSNTRLYITSNGNIGIGTTSSLGNAQLVVNQTNSSGNGDIISASASGSKKFTVTNGGNIESVAGAQWVPFTDSTTALQVANSSGTYFVNFDTTNSRVGIGTNSPNTNLQIGVNSNPLYLGDTTNTSVYENFNGRDYVGYDGSSSVIQGLSGHGVKLNVNNNTFGSGTAMTITSGGFVGIGTTNIGNGQLVISQTNTSGSGDIFSASQSASTKFTIGNNGTVTLVGNNTADIITTSTNTLKLDTAGAAGITIGGANTNAITLGGSQNPTLTLSGTGLTTLGGNLTVNGTTENVGNGSGYTIQTSSNAGLSLLSAGSGNITLGQNSGTGNVIIQPNAGGQAALMVIDNGAGDILTATSGGTTKFRLTNDGSALFQGSMITSIGSGASANGSNAVINNLGDQGSMIPNSGFEANTLGGFADGWVAAATNSATITNDTTTVEEGNASVSIATSTNTAIYSACVPLSQKGAYTLNYFAKASNAAATLYSAIDTYISKANCQSDTSVTTTSPAQVAPVTTNWAKYGSNTTAVAGLGATATWGRVHLFVTCTSSCTVNIDGVRLVQSSSGQGLDYAENYPADPQNIPTAGDVVSIENTNNIVKVIPSNQQTNYLVVGVVSTNPGMIMDDGSVPDPKVPIALSGRVPVKVTTENGNIQVGDPLTSSSQPGVAMKATKPGIVIGKALESYSGTGVGEVLTFIAVSYSDPVQQLALVPQSSQPILTPTPSQAVTMTTLTSLTLNGTLTVTQAAEFKANILFDAIAEFFDTVIFHKDVTFLGRPTFNQDTAGFAVIKQGATNVDITFQQAYAQLPLVTSNPAIEQENQATEAAAKQFIFATDTKYVVSNLTNQGFTIELNKPAPADIRFIWTAFAVNNAQTSTSSVTPTLQPTDNPTPTPDIIYPTAIMPSDTPTPTVSPTNTVTPISTQAITPSSSPNPSP